MRLSHRHTVARTRPSVTIGRRRYADPKSGELKVSPYWTATWCIRGKQDSKSFRTADRSSAIKLARQLAVSISLGEGKIPRDPPTLKEVVESFLSIQKLRNRAPKTLEKYDLVCRTFLAWSKERRDRPAELFREPDILAFDAEMRSKQLGDKTRYDRLILVKQFFNQAVRSGMIGKSPLAGVSFPIPSWSLQPCFEPDQVWSLLQAVTGATRLVWSLMAYAGLRFGEVRDLRWSDLLLTRGRHGYICVCRGGSSSSTKTRKNRLIPIHPDLRSALDRHPRVGERVVYAAQLDLSRNPVSALAERPLLSLLKRQCRARGFDAAVRFKLHTFRHAFASMCARANVSYKYALAWMGHQSSEVLDLYYRMYDATADAAMQTICYEPPLGDLSHAGAEYEI